MFSSEQSRIFRTVTALAARTQHAHLLDAAVTYLVVNPRASLADIAAAAGMGRTTLFKRYATRDELEHAVALPDIPRRSESRLIPSGIDISAGYSVAPPRGSGRS